MTTQLSLFDALRSPPILRPVDRDGHVVQGEPHETFTLPHPRWPTALGRIELHQARNGLWMWSTSFQASKSGGGYKVGEKWGKFASTRDDALHYAVDELTAKLGRIQEPDAVAAKITAWAATLQGVRHG